VNCTFKDFGFYRFQDHTSEIRKSKIKY